MKKLLFVLLVLISLNSCKKDKDCISNINEEIQMNIHYNEMSCTLENFTRYYSSESEFYSDVSCSNVPIPFPLDFNGIILAQGVKVPYVSENLSTTRPYNLNVEICKDTCLKKIEFHFIITTMDTFEILEHNENVVVVLENVDDSYSVNFTHEIIPFGE